jgi:glycosyltransferase involved in cell wall biosynthesis
MRIPFEGMLAADAYDGTPLLVSIWGNDLTLRGPSTPLMRHYTSWTLQAAQGLHADCRRDIRLGKQWGFDTSQPTCVLPGNGGVRIDLFLAPAALADAPVVVNPRGARSYVRTDVFLQAIPLVLAKHPDARFLCASLAGDRQALKRIDALRIENAVELLPQLTQVEMADLFKGAQVVVSPSVHDGTPNSLLEGMACGCLPVAGDLESIREWITPGENGLLTDATDARALAEAIMEGLENKNLRLQAAGLNRDIILQRAEYTRCMADADGFYRRIILRA